MAASWDTIYRDKTIPIRDADDPCSVVVISPSSLAFNANSPDPVTA